MMTADYPDWLNPMLVKELRQGLCKGAFTATFILLQVIMLLIVGLRLLSDSPDDYREVGAMLQAMLTGGLSFIMLFLMPIRSLSAIQEEQKLQTLELVQMTWMGSLKIVWGKWAAVMSQGLLFMIAVLPYGVLRYFFGGMEIEESLVGLARIVLSSMLLTAFGVWLSTMGPAARGLTIFFVFMWVQSFMFGTAFMGSRLFSSSFSGDDWTMAYGALISTVYILTVAASRIGSVAENHSSTLRGLALIAGLVGLVGACFRSFGWMSVGAPIMIWSILEALTERTSEVPSMYARWLRWGMPGRLACRVLNPGWATGLLHTFIVLAMILTVVIASSAKSMSSLKPAIALGALTYCAFVTPVCLCCTRLGSKHRGMIYTLIQGLAILLSAIASTADTLAFNKNETPAGAIMIASHPSAAAFWLAFNGDSSNHNPLLLHLKYITFITVPLCAVILVFLLIRARREFKLMARQEQKAMAAPQPT